MDVFVFLCGNMDVFLCGNMDVLLVKELLNLKMW